MKGVPAPYLARNIAELVQRSKGRLNPAQAGQVLLDNMTEEKAGDFGFLNILTRTDPRDVNLGNGYRFNWSKIDQDVEAARSGRTGDQFRTQDQIKIALDRKSSADAEYQAAWNARQQYVRAVQSNPKAVNQDRENRINARLQAAQQKRDASIAQYDMIIKASGNGTAPAPEAVSKPWYESLFTIRRGAPNKSE
jgi:hypothetical protein